MRKKAQSEAITVVLIILLVLAAVVIVYQAVKGTVTKAGETLTTQSSCIGIDLQVQKITCTGTSANSVAVTIARGGDSFTGNLLTVGVSDGLKSGTNTATLDKLGTATVTVSAGTGSVFTCANEFTVNAGVTDTVTQTSCKAIQAKLKV